MIEQCTREVWRGARVSGSGRTFGFTNGQNDAGKVCAKPARDLLPLAVAGPEVSEGLNTTQERNDAREVGIEPDDFPRSSSDGDET